MLLRIQMRMQRIRVVKGIWMSQYHVFVDSVKWLLNQRITNHTRVLYYDEWYISSRTPRHNKISLDLSSSIVDADAAVAAVIAVFLLVNKWKL